MNGNKRIDSPREPIAIVGMACRFPGASDLVEFWRLLSAGGDATSDYADNRGPALDSILTPAAQQKGQIANVRGGFLPRIDLFDASFFGISPREANNLDPQQRLLLELTWEALEDGGIVPGRIRGSRTGVFVGLWTNDYEQSLYETPDDIEFYATTGCGRYAASGRISYNFDFRGPTLTVDTGCSSSLVAVHLACRSLLNGDCDMAVVGAANLIVRPEITIAYSHAGILSPGGRCKFADESADGYVRGEGGAALVLKPLSKAVADSDRIHALILGGSITSHGGASGLLVHPAQTGLEAMLREAWADAGISAGDIGYIEAHGPGTRAGDPVEIGAIGQILMEQGVQDTCLVGSVKTNIGHLEAAAGLAGLIKTVLTLQHQAIPPTLYFRKPSPAIDWARVPVRIPTELTPWPATASPATAGVNSFGITGTTAHIVVREARHLESRNLHADQRQSCLLTLSAHTSAALKQLAKNWLENALTDDCNLHDLCYTASNRRTHHEYRASFVAPTVHEMRGELEAFVADQESPRRSVGRTQGHRCPLAFVFPGQGSQWIGMGRELFAKEPVFRRILERADQSVNRFAGWSLISLLTGENAEQIDEIDRIQPLLFAMQVALTALLRSWGVTPDAVVGHSMGEVAAAVVAGALSLEEGARVICARSRLMRALKGKGGMAVVGLPVEQTETVIKPYDNRLSVAASNSLASTVVSGDSEAIADLLRQLKNSDIFCRAIRVDVASHSAHVDSLMEALGSELAPMATQPPTIPLYSTVTGELEAASLDSSYWVRNLRQPVRFATAIQSLVRDGYEFFLEVSPHPALVSAVGETIQSLGKNVIAAGSLRRDEPEVQQLLNSIGDLYCAGYDVDWSKLYSAGECVALPAYPWQKERFWFDLNAVSKSRTKRGSRSLGTPLIDHMQVASRPGLHVWRVDNHRLSSDAYRVDGVPRLPLSQCFQLVMDAAATLMGTGEIALEEVHVNGHINGTDLHEVQLSLEVVDSQAARFELQSQAAMGSPWVSVAHGLASKKDTHIDTKQITAPVEGSGSFYEEAADHGVQFSSAIQVLDQVVEGIQESVATVRLDGTPGTALEAMCQMVTRAAGKTFQPHTIGSVRVSEGNPDRRGIARCVAIAASPVVADEWTANVEIRTEDGACISEMRNVELRLVEDSPALPASDYLYEEEWISQPLLSPRQSVPKHWVVLGGSSFAHQIKYRLESRGERVTLASSAEQICWNNGDSTAAVIVVPEIASDGDLEVAVPHASIAHVQQLSQVARVLSATQFSDAPRLWVITRGLEDLDGMLMEERALAQSVLRGLGRVILRELPEHRCTNVDVGLCPDIREIEAMIDGFLCDDSEDLVAFREDRRYVCRLRKANPNNQPLDWPVRKDASYLITGGLGGLGLLFAQRLSEAGAGHIVLAGRSAPKPSTLEIIRDVERSGTRVTVQQCDIADRSQVRLLLDSEALRKLPLAGVIHAAAVTDDVLVADLTSESMARVFASKALGAWHLHELTAAMSLEFFVLFSSIAAVLPQPGQGSYAAANAFLDTLACLRNKNGLPAVAVRWAPWTATGIWTEGKKKTVAAYRRQGIGRISARKGNECLLQALRSGAPHLLAASIDWKKSSEFYGSSSIPSLLRSLLEPAAADFQSTVQLTDIQGRLLAAGGMDVRREVLDTHIRQTLAKVLRIDASRFNSTRPLGQSGLDSLMGLEFVRRLGADLGMRLPASLVYNYPTIARMADHLAERFEQTENDSRVPRLAPPAAEVNALVGAVHELTDEQVLAELLGDAHGSRI